MNKPKANMWDEKPMEFKGPAGGAASNFNIPSLADTNMPVSQLKQPTPVAKNNKIDFLDNIPSLGGGDNIGSIVPTLNAK
jgi:hypothetical protein